MTAAPASAQRTSAAHGLGWPLVADPAPTARATGLGWPADPAPTHDIPEGEA